MDIERTWTALQAKIYDGNAVSVGKDLPMLDIERNENNAVISIITDEDGNTEPLYSGTITEVYDWLNGFAEGKSITWHGDEVNVNKVDLYDLPRNRAAKLKRMHEAIIDNGDEDLYEIWIRDGIPDEPEDVDFFDIAMDEQSYTEICDLYKKLAKHF